MYSTYHNVLEKNQMMTPPTIGLTSSIVNDKLSNITLEDNSSGLFAMNEDKSAIQTKDGVPVNLVNLYAPRLGGHRRGRWPLYKIFFRMLGIEK